MESLSVLIGTGIRASLASQASQALVVSDASRAARGAGPEEQRRVRPKPAAVKSQQQSRTISKDVYLSLSSSSQEPGNGRGQSRSRSGCQERATVSLLESGSRSGCLSPRERLSLSERAALSLRESGSLSERAALSPIYDIRNLFAGCPERAAGLSVVQSAAPSAKSSSVQGGQRYLPPHRHTHFSLVTHRERAR